MPVAGNTDMCQVNLNQQAMIQRKYNLTAKYDDTWLYNVWVIADARNMLIYSELS